MNLEIGLPIEFFSSTFRKINMGNTEGIYSSNVKFRTILLDDIRLNKIIPKHKQYVLINSNEENNINIYFETDDLELARRHLRYQEDTDQFLDMKLVDMEVNSYIGVNHSILSYGDLSEAYSSLNSILDFGFIFITDKNIEDVLIKIKNEETDILDDEIEDLKVDFDEHDNDFYFIRISNNQISILEIYDIEGMEYDPDILTYVSEYIISFYQGLQTVIDDFNIE